MDGNAGKLGWLLSVPSRTSRSLSILSPVGIYMLKWLLQMNSKRSNKLDVAVRKFILQFHENSIR